MEGTDEGPLICPFILGYGPEEGVNITLEIVALMPVQNSTHQFKLRNTYYDPSSTPELESCEGTQEIYNNSIGTGFTSAEILEYPDPVVYITAKEYSTEAPSSEWEESTTIETGQSQDESEDSSSTDIIDITGSQDQSRDSSSSNNSTEATQSQVQTSEESIETGQSHTQTEDSEDITTSTAIQSDDDDDDEESGKERLGLQNTLVFAITSCMALQILA
jgi:hypothetical protein